MQRTLVGGLAAMIVGGVLALGHFALKNDGRVYAADAQPSDAEKISAQIHAALKTLGTSKSDVETRIAMAKIASDKKAYEAARDALEDAARIEPGNKEIAALLVDVRKHLPAAATAPATNPAAAPATKPVEEPKAQSGPLFKRMVTPAEINRIRQIEWRPDDTVKVRISIDADTKKKFLSSTTDYTPSEFNKKPMEEQADLILTKGLPQMRNGVHILTDPQSVAEFKKGAQHVILLGCAAANCHNGTKPGFMLFNPPVLTAEATYSNFLILQKYTSQVKGVERLMVDRNDPESSLLLKYLLSPDISDLPHPTVPNFKAAIRAKSDRNYQAVLHWIQGLKAIAPDYGVDLTIEPKTPVKPAARSQVLPPSAPFRG